MNRIKIFQSEEYIKPEKIIGEEFKVYYGWTVKALSDLAYIYYWYCSDYIINGN